MNLRKYNLPILSLTFFVATTIPKLADAQVKHLDIVEPRSGKVLSVSVDLETGDYEFDHLNNITPQLKLTGRIPEDWQCQALKNLIRKSNLNLNAQALRANAPADLSIQLFLGNENKDIEDEIRLKLNHRILSNLKLWNSSRLIFMNKALRLQWDSRSIGTHSQDIRQEIDRELQSHLRSATLLSELHSSGLASFRSDNLAMLCDLANGGLSILLDLTGVIRKDVVVRQTISRQDILELNRELLQNTRLLVQQSQNGPGDSDRQIIAAGLLGYGLAKTNVSIENLNAFGILTLLKANFHSDFTSPRTVTLAEATRVLRAISPRKTFDLDFNIKEKTLKVEVTK